MTMTRAPICLLLAAFLALAGAGPAARADEPTVPESVRKAQIKKLAKQIRKKARSPRAPKYKTEIMTLLESLQVLGGPEVSVAALEAVPMVDDEVRDRAFLIAESEPHVRLVKPLAEIFDDKAYRQDTDLRRRVARALSIVGDPSGMPPLTDSMRTDEDPEVVAATAESLGTFTSAPLALRKDAVKRMVDTYTSTWNLMMSIRPEDRILRAKMKTQYKVYGRSLRDALQALTGEQGISRPQEWREWWNEHKKRTDW